MDEGIYPYVFRLYIVPYFHVHQIGGLFGVGKDSEFLAEFAAHCLVVALATVEVASDSGVPFAGLDIAVFAAFLEEHPPIGMEDDHMDGPVYKAWIAVAFFAGSGANEIAIIVDDIEVFRFCFGWRDH